MAMRMTVKNKINSSQGRVESFHFEIASKKGTLLKMYAMPPTVTMIFIIENSRFVHFF
jgi:hypothetical protein